MVPGSSRLYQEGRLTTEDCLPCGVGSSLLGLSRMPRPFRDAYDRCSSCRQRSRSTLETIMARHDDRLLGLFCDNCARRYESEGWQTLLIVVPDTDA